MIVFFRECVDCLITFFDVTLNLRFILRIERGGILEILSIHTTILDFVPNLAFLFLKEPDYIFYVMSLNYIAFNSLFYFGDTSLVFYIMNTIAVGGKIQSVRLSSEN